MTNVFGDPNLRISLNPPPFANGTFEIRDGPTTFLSIDTDPSGSNPGDVVIHNALRIGKRLDTGTVPISLEAPDGLTLRGGAPNDPWLSVVYVGGSGEMRLEASQSSGQAAMGLSGQEIILTTPLTGQAPGLRVVSQDAVVLSLFAESGPQSKTTLFAQGGDLTVRVPEDGLSSVVLSPNARIEGNLTAGRARIDGNLVVQDGRLRLRGGLAGALLDDPSGARYFLGSNALGLPSITFSTRTIRSGPVLESVFSWNRSFVPAEGAYVNEVRGFLGLGRFPEQEFVHVSTSSDLEARAGGLVDMFALTDDSWLRLWDGGGQPEAMIANGLLGGFTAPATQASLGFTSGGRLRMGVFSGAPGSGAPAIFSDRLTVDDAGQLFVYESGSTGSPGATPCLRVQHTPDTRLTVGTRTVQGRGQIRLSGGTTATATLLVNQADDGQPVYWSAWRDGGEVVLVASLNRPTAWTDGKEIGRFS